MRAQDKETGALTMNELRVVATILAERTGLIGKGVPYVDLTAGDREDLTKIIARARRRRARQEGASHGR